MDELRPCPLCGGEIVVDLYIDRLDERRTEGYCSRCKIRFIYRQIHGKTEKFSEVWNRRVSDGQT